MVLSSRLQFPEGSEAVGLGLLSYKQQQVVRGLPATGVFALA